MHKDTKRVVQLVSAFSAVFRYMHLDNVDAEPLQSFDPLFAALVAMNVSEARRSKNHRVEMLQSDFRPQSQRHVFLD